jgi:hypothetical protein
MKKVSSFWAIAVSATVAVSFTACNVDDDFYAEPRATDDASSETRTVSDVEYQVVDFENAPASVIAGPTSYGENLYKNGASPQYTDWSDPTTGLKFSINPTGYDGTNYWNGGTAISNWNYRSNIAGKSGDWWYSYENQCSVYNTDSTDGANVNAGHSGSNFGVAFGYTDTYSGFIGCAKIAFPGRTERTFDQMYICNSSYGYGVIVNGNSFTQGSIPSKSGWFKLVARGYRGNGTLAATDEIYLADYRNGASNCITTWTLFDLKNIKKQKVNRIEFDFAGSDTGSYGLNTPAYVCIDDIRVSKQ